MRLSIVLAAVGWAVGWYLWGRPRRLADHREARPEPQVPVVVIIPARDEAKVLGPLLDDLLAQERPAARIVVVDDHSRDATAEVAAARGPRVEVLAAPALPAGWAGKTWACHTGVQAVAPTLAPDDLLVFCDADVRLAPDALGLVAAAAGEGGATSVQPFHRTERAGEQLSLCCGLVALMALGAGRCDRPPSGLSGPLIATTVADYAQAGGHEAVRSEVIEDVALGQRYLRAGLNVSVLLGGPSVRYRMYPEGLRQLVEGWSKNLASGAGAVPRWRTALTIGWVTALGSAAVDLIGAVGGSQPLLPALLLYAACCAQIAVLGRRHGTFGVPTALVYPVPLAAFVGLFLRSTYSTFVHHSVVWRGRTLPVRERAR